MTMLQALELLGALSATLFAGAALNISFVEHPARMALDTRAAAAQWAPSYRRATWMQTPLALLSLVCGAAAWLMGAGAGWLVAALLIGVVVPFTFLVIMPTNHELPAPGRDLDGAETRTLLTRWGNLHAVRSALSVLATARSKDRRCCCRSRPASGACHSSAPRRCSVRRRT
jgi:Anthrone oxygenase